ncbi:MAG: hypothetical protein WC271_16040 [Bacteroidales bacterium]|jgi:hypothetical protein|nr:hypothetical protein [Bacteroidales bacterium]
MTIDYAIENGRNVNASQIGAYFIQSFVMSSVSMDASKGIGSVFKHEIGSLLNELGRASAHGIFNGTMRIAQGGKFEHGFLSGFVSSLGGSAMIKYGANMDIGSKIALSAALGGTAEVLGGGKFANGAVTGAYVMMFNHLMHPPQTGGTPRKLADDDQENLLKKVNEATRQERVNNMANNDPWNPEIDDSISVDFNIDGLPEGNSLTGYEIYTTGGVEINVDNISIQATVIYSPSANSQNNIVRQIGDYRIDNTPGRMRFVNSIGYPVVEIQFNNNSDFLKYRQYIYGGE